MIYKRVSIPCQRGKKTLNYKGLTKEGERRKRGKEIQERRGANEKGWRFSTGEIQKKKIFRSAEGKEILTCRE